MPANNPAAKLRTALELFELGQQMMRTRLHRENPGWDEDDVDRAITAWMHDRPGAQHGDHPGRPSNRFTFGPS